MTSSPIVARWELSRRLASRRKGLGMDVSTVTKALGFSRNYWSAVENDRTLIAVEKLQLLFDLMEIEQSDQHELLELRSIGRKRGWWDDYTNILDDVTRRFIGLEDGATRIRTYESNLIPGLLQIGDYTRSVLESDPARNQLELDDFITIRAMRQRRIDGPDPLQFVAVMSEACLMQQVAGPEIQQRQLEHLLRLIVENPETLQIRIVPFTVNPGVLASASTLLFIEFENRHLPDIAWHEAIRLLDEVDSDHEQFRRMDQSWQEGLARSSDRMDSVSTIEMHLSALR